MIFIISFYATDVGRPSTLSQTKISGFISWRYGSYIDGKGKVKREKGKVKSEK